MAECGARGVKIREYHGTKKAVIVNKNKNKINKNKIRKC